MERQALGRAAGSVANGIQAVCESVHLDTVPSPTPRSPTDLPPAELDARLDFLPSVFSISKRVK